MKLYQRILICGPARSGNTLLLHLMGAGFRSVRICHGERVPEQSACRPGRFIIGKKPWALKHIEAYLGQWDLGIILTIRDPRDSICSPHEDKPFWMTPERWSGAAKLVHPHRDHPQVLVVRFEELLRNPAFVQGQISNRFGLAFRRPFSECYRHFDTADTGGIDAMHGARPLDTSRIGHWRKTEGKRLRVEVALRDNPDMKEWMEKWDYE